MEEWIKKSDVLEMLCLPSDILAEHIYELKGVWVDEDIAEDSIDDAMIGAAVKGCLKGADLLDLFKEQGLFAIYNLGLQHMYEYLKGE